MLKKVRFSSRKSRKIGSGRGIDLNGLSFSKWPSCEDVLKTTNTSDPNKHCFE